MIPFLIMVALMLIALLIGFPIWVLIKFGRLSDVIEQLRRQIDNLEDRFSRVKKELESLRSEREEVPQPEAPRPVVPQESPAPFFSPPIIEQPTMVTPMPEPVLAQAPEAPVPTPPPIVPPLHRPVSNVPKIPTINWEQFMGVKLFAWIGGLALFIGVALFLKYSFEHNLISPELRVAMGFLVGIGLLVGGFFVSKKEYAVTAQTLCGTGVVILYAVTFSARSIYHLFGQFPAFGLMVLITATAFLLAVRLNAMVVAILGMLGGFLTPILLSTGQDNPLGLFVYIGLLDVGLIAVALHRRWNFLPVLGVVGTVIMQIGWTEKFFEVPKVFTGMTIFLSFSALFVAAFFFAQKRKQNDKWFAAPAILLPFVSFGFAFYLLGYSELSVRPGLVFSFVFLADLCLLALTLTDTKLFRVHVFAGITVFTLLSAWTVQSLNNALLNWGLGFYLLFAVLHSIFPILLQRLRPAIKPTWWGHIFPPIALILVMIPIVKIPEISFLVWPCILLLDVLAIGLAVMTASLLSIIAVLLLTLVATALWIFHIPADLTGVSAPLLLIGGFAIFFFVVAIFATRKIWAKWSQNGVPNTDDMLGFSATPETLAQLPAMSAILPFLLLIMVAVRLPLADPSPVFGLALLLIFLMLGVTRKYMLDWLPAVGLGCVFALEHSWHFKQFQPEHAVLCLGWYVGFHLVFALFPFVFRKHFSQRTIPWAVAALSGPASFYLVHRVVSSVFPNDFMGALPAVFALPSIVSLIVLLKKTPQENPARMTQLAWFGGVALFFITLIFPMQFDRQWITIGWALEGAALLWLFHRVPHNGLRVTGVVLLCVAFARLALNPAVLSYHVRSATPIWNWYLYSYSIVTLCLFAGAKLLERPRHIVIGTNVPPILWSLGTVLAFLLLNIEIADYFSEQQQTLTFQFSGNLARDMTYTISWALFALILLIIGIAKKIPGARYASLGLLAVALLKLFFHDLAHLAQLYRIGALISVAIIAMVASFCYQKFFASNAKAQSPPNNEPPVV
ncbi:MAG: hypothetical protein JWM68_1210 [Verrucomicrobiales bacterium]|nr:hypothetical protein [Verrucomicrobiales bacterium]